jgi:hypothetical protein
MPELPDAIAIPCGDCGATVGYFMGSRLDRATRAALRVLTSTGGMFTAMVTGAPDSAPADEASAPRGSGLPIICPRCFGAEPTDTQNGATADV